MGERLGKVAHEPTRDRVVLLGQQAEVVAQVEEPLEELAGIVVTTQQRQAVSHPERAGQEGTFSAGEAVDLARVRGAIAEDEVPFDQLSLDGLDRPPHPRVSRREESDQRDHQQAGIERIGPVVLGERSLRGVESLFAHLVVDLGPDLAPPFDRPLFVMLLDRLDRPVECHPGHDLGVGEVATGSPDLPNTVVRFTPAGLQERQQRPLQLPGRFAVWVAGLHRLVERGHDFAIDVQLELAGRRVADPYRARALVAREPVDLPFVEAALTPGPVHDLHLRGVPGSSSQEPASPGHGLLVEPAPHERLECEGGVAQPAEAVVPVASASDGLGKRRGRCGHDAAGRFVGECLEGDERADDSLAVLALVGALRGPLLPPLLGVLDGVGGIHRAGRSFVRRVPRQGERNGLPLGHGEL